MLYLFFFPLRSLQILWWRKRKEKCTNEDLKDSGFERSFSAAVWRWIIMISTWIHYVIGLSGQYNKASDSKTWLLTNKGVMYNVFWLPYSFCAKVTLLSENCGLIPCITEMFWIFWELSAKFALIFREYFGRRTNHEIITLAVCWQYVNSVLFCFFKLFGGGECLILDYERKILCDRFGLRFFQMLSHREQTTTSLAVVKCCWFVMFNKFCIWRWKWFILGTGRCEN